MNKNIGDMTESELKDFIIELQEENSRYERINKKYKEVIEKAIEYINSQSPDAGVSGKHIKEILKEVE